MPRCASERCVVPAPRWWGRWRRPAAVVDGQWLCSRGCLEDVARARLAGDWHVAADAPQSARIRLGALLRHHGACSAEAIADALAAQRESHLRLGEQLRTMGAVAPDAVLRALAAQTGVSYLASVDLSAVRDAPGGLALDTIQALGLLPISAPDGGRIRVAFPAPVPRAALSAFRQLTGWMPEPYLVEDEAWLTLLEHYGAAHRGVTRPELPVALVRTADLDLAVAHVARAVQAVGEASLRDARWGRFVWVRVEGAGHGALHDLLFERAAVTPITEEQPWPAVTTSH